VLRLPTERRAQLTDFFTKFRGSNAAFSTSGKHRKKSASVAYFRGR